MPTIKHALGESLVILFGLFCCSSTLFAQNDVADVVSQDLTVGANEKQRYFLIGPHQDVVAPNAGFGLIVVLPGGDGSAEFHPFVKRLYKHSVPDRFIVAQPVAVNWTPKQKIVWPTQSDSVAKMKFTTEEFVDAVIQDVSNKYPLDQQRIFTLSWSSSGPAAYAISLSSPRITGSFIAMSVFKPKQLPALEKAQGQAYYLYHSPADRVCPYRMAQQAEGLLSENGATVNLVTYDGGHGWQGDVFNNIRQGIEWLDEHATSATE